MLLLLYIINKIKMKIIFFLFLFVDYVLSATYYQLMPKFSLNFRNVNFPISAIKNYFTRKGDITIDNKHLIMTPYINDTYGSIVTKTAFNSSIFEMHINIRIKPSKEEGSFFSIWFFNNNTERYLNLSSKFEGFGIVLNTMPQGIGKQKTSIHLIRNENYTSMKEAIMNRTDKDIKLNDKLSCFGNFVNQNLKLVIRYDEGSVRVTHSSDDSFNADCIKKFMKPLKKNYFRYALFAYNGDNIVYDPLLSEKKNQFKVKDSIEVTKLVMFNMNIKYKEFHTYNQSDYFKFKEIKENVDLIEKYAEKTKVITIDDVIAIISEMNKKIDINKDIREINFTYVNKSLYHLREYSDTLIKELSSLNATVTDKQKSNQLLKSKESILHSEIDTLVNKWDKFANKSSTVELSSDLTQRIFLLQSTYNKTKKIQSYLTKYINENINELSKEVSNNTETSPFLMIFYAVLILLNIMLIYLIYLKIGSKEKKN